MSWKRAVGAVSSNIQTVAADAKAVQIVDHGSGPPFRKVEVHRSAAGRVRMPFDEKALVGELGPQERLREHFRLRLRLTGQLRRTEQEREAQVDAPFLRRNRVGPRRTTVRYADASTLAAGCA